MPNPAALKTSGLFAKRPQTIVGDLYFYHTMEVPGRGLVTGVWDLRAGMDAYLGRVDYAGLSVLEIGPASGLVTFSLEQRGASVVAVDLPVHGRPDFFPDLTQTFASERRWKPEHHQAVRNAFWTAHRAFDSHALLIESNVDDLDPAVTGFDVAIVCNVMQHRRDPIGMLLNVADRARTVVVTEAAWCGETNDDKPVMELLTSSLRSGQPYSWFMVSPRLVEDLLSLRGFTIVARDIHHQPFTPAASQPTQQVRHYTITATKSPPQAEG